jgi:hypothetical protein
MVINELIVEIRERFRKGQRRNEIKEDLIEQGYDEDDIDETIAKIQRDALKQLPGISWIYQQIEHFESKPNAASPQMTVLLMVICVVLLIILASALYFILDPLGENSGGRDTKRQSDAIIIQNGLSQYFQKNNRYPDTLDEMVPGSLSDVPHDPQSGHEYTYQPLDNNQNFNLCIAYEQQRQVCFNATSDVSPIPVVPTDTPIPSFVPQSDSVSVSPTKNYPIQ